LNARGPNALLLELVADFLWSVGVQHTALTLSLAVDAPPSEAVFSHGGSAP
jgi:hypothetical protein